jgi:hypothetical protein
MPMTSFIKVDIYMFSPNLERLMVIVHIIEQPYTQNLEKIVTWVHKGEIMKRWDSKTRLVGLLKV